MPSYYRNSRSSMGRRTRRAPARDSRRRTSTARRAWSNSVGTRFRKQYWINPTVGRGKSIRNKTVSSSEAAACMAVALNAFSDKTMQPRFPDGKANESVGMKYQMINEVEYTVDGEMEIIFFPGLNCAIHVQHATSKSLGAQTSTDNNAQTKVQRITNHITGPVETAGDLVTMQQVDERHVAKWRVVSYGLLLSLVNNSEENDGWWEACRITPSNDIRQYGVTVAGTGGSAEGPYGTQPLTFWHDIPVLTSSEMLNQASYTTGKLRNIHNVLFQLNPEYEDREFVDLSKETTMRVPSLSAAYGIPLDAGNNAYPPGATQWLGGKCERSDNSSPRINDEAVSQFIDGAFDAIFIRIHGVDNSSGRSPSRLTMHSVMNQEIVYDEKALNAKFHQGSVFHHAHERIKGTPSAGQPNQMVNL